MTKVREVFDASICQDVEWEYDTLLVRPTVHSSLVDVLLHFWQHRVALVADISPPVIPSRTIAFGASCSYFLYQTECT